MFTAVIYAGQFCVSLTEARVMRGGNLNKGNIFMRSGYTKFVQHFLKLELLEEDTAHCGWSHPWRGSPEFYKITG